MSTDERLPIIDNPQSDRVRGIVSLGRRSFRARRGLLRVEGPQAVAELLLWRGDKIRDVYFTPEAAGRYESLWDLAAASTRWRHLIAPEVARAIAEEAQGVIAVCDASAISGTPVDADTEAGALVVLPATQDPGNAGTIVRAADGFGAAGVIAAKGTVDLAGPKVIRASVGSVFHLAIEQGEAFADIVQRLRREGRKVLGTSGATPSVSLDSIDLREPHAWVFGNEAGGLSAAEEALCDTLVHIPMSGHAESMNVAVAAGICLYASQQAGGTDD